MRAYLHIDKPTMCSVQEICIQINISAVPRPRDVFHMTEDIQTQLSDMMVTYYDNHKDWPSHDYLFDKPIERNGKRYYELDDYMIVDYIEWFYNDDGIYEPYITLRK